MFGLDIGLGALGIRLLPGLAPVSAGGGFFWQGVILTASNPLTIVFWSGMFTAQMAKNQWNRRELSGFAAGCVLSTLVFLTAVAALASALSRFLPEIVIQTLNLGVGAVLIFYGIKLLMQKDTARA